MLVINPIAGGTDKAELQEIVLAFAKEQGVELNIYETTGENDEEEILNMHNKLNPERILVAGGDGTIKMVAEALEDQDAIIGILPAGSANGLATDLNCPSELEENLSIAFSHKPIALDMISINGKKSLHLSDLGLNAELVRNYENGNTRGMLGYAMQAITTLSEQEPPFKATVIANGETITTMARMIVIANSQKYGTGVTINPEGKMDDGLFEIVILKNLDFLVIGKIITGNMPVETGDVVIITAAQATITTEVPVAFQIDGEYEGEVTELDIQILPGHMKVAVPLDNEGQPAEQQ
jgi:diacylglycerol kinase (ATP)